MRAALSTLLLALLVSALAFGEPAGTPRNRCVAPGDSDHTSLQGSTLTYTFVDAGVIKADSITLGPVGGPRLVGVSSSRLDLYASAQVSFSTPAGGTIGTFNILGSPAVDDIAVGANGSNGGLRLGVSKVLALNSQPPSGVTACSGGSAASITWTNGTALFQFDVGTSCAGETTAAITFPTAAAHCWGCTCWDVGAATNIRTSACTSTTVTTITNYGTSVATPANWTDGADIQCTCHAG